MSEYKPNGWILFRKIDNHEDVRLFVTWSGGYLDGDSWRINSGVKTVIYNKPHYQTISNSGTIYWCNEQSYGIRGAYNSFMIDELEKRGFEFLTEEESLEYLKGKLE